MANINPPTANPITLFCMDKRTPRMRSLEAIGELQLNSLTLAREANGSLHGKCNPYEAILMTICLPFIFWGCIYQLQQAERLNSDVPVRFIYKNAQAREVCLAGSFNQWSPGGQCMVRTGETWALDILLPRGRHEYVFVIDGHTWQPDPGAVLSEETGFGMKSSILIIE